VIAEVSDWRVRHVTAGSTREGIYSSCSIIYLRGLWLVTAGPRVFVWKQHQKSLFAKIDKECAVDAGTEFAESIDAGLYSAEIEEDGDES
jgi:hypothetical protein